MKTVVNVMMFSNNKDEIKVTSGTDTGPGGGDYVEFLFKESFSGDIVKVAMTKEKAVMLHAELVESLWNKGYVNGYVGIFPLEKK